jgi:recombination protein RecT
MGDVRTAAVAQRDQLKEKQIAVARFIEKLSPQIARALPRHLNGDRMTRLALTAVRTTPALATCSEVSMAGALLTAAALGLEPNTPTGECYLVPYSGEVQFQLGYQGMVRLYWQHPLAAQLVCEAVYEADDFSYSMGSNAHLDHTPNKRVENRGDVIYFYAFAKLKSGAEAFVVLTPAECQALRQGKVGPDPRFKGGDPQRWMERKTALRQLFKLLPKDPNLTKAIDADDKQSGTELYRAAAAERVEPFDNAERPAIEGTVDTSTGEVVGGGQA